MDTLLEGITSRDSHRIWSSACAIITLRDKAALDHLANHLAAIESQTTGVDLGGALYPNKEHLRVALRKLAYHRDCAGCLCHLYPDYSFYNPVKEVEDGNVRVDQVTYIENKWVDFYACTCLVCGARYRVEEGESHYMWWSWKEMPPEEATPEDQNGA